MQKEDYDAGDPDTASHIKKNASVSLHINSQRSKEMKEDGASHKKSCQQPSQRAGDSRQNQENGSQKFKGANDITAVKRKRLGDEIKEITFHPFAYGAENMLGLGRVSEFEKERLNENKCYPYG